MKKRKEFVELTGDNLKYVWKRKKKESQKRKEGRGGKEKGGKRTESREKKANNSMQACRRPPMASYFLFERIGRVRKGSGQK